MVEDQDDCDNEDEDADEAIAYNCSIETTCGDVRIKKLDVAATDEVKPQNVWIKSVNGTIQAHIHHFSGKFILKSVNGKIKVHGEGVTLNEKSGEADDENVHEKEVTGCVAGDRGDYLVIETTSGDIRVTFA